MPRPALDTKAASSPASHFSPVRDWAAENGFGINDVYGFVRREEDPMPHIRRGRRRLIDDELAVAWVRRNFGVGC